VLHARHGGQPWRVRAVYEDSAVLVNRSGETIRVPLANLMPDPLHDTSQPAAGRY
jgi:hypothetical protein